MNQKFMLLYSVIAIFLVFSGLIIVFILPQTSNSVPGFPFKITGGTLIEINRENHTGIIWGQSFEIKITQEFNTSIEKEHFSIHVLNFPTSGILVMGLMETEKVSIQGSLSCKLDLSGRISRNRIITITKPPEDQAKITFLAMGDTQGFTKLYSEMIQNSNTLGNNFILHLGDMTASGSVDSFETFKNLSKVSEIPIFTTPGNHDIKLSNSTAYYEKFFGKSEYSFLYNGYLFISLNSSSGFYSENSFIFLSSLLESFPTTPKVIFTHIPIFDPRLDKDHDLLNETQSTKLLTLLNNTNVKAVISGHIHYFNHTLMNGIHFITSGGGGAYLYEAPEDGGLHHYTEVTINVITDEFTINPVPLMKKTQPTDVFISKENISRVISIEDLLSEFTLTYGNSSFQNQYDNWRANGSYIGIKISDLVETVGGMSEDQWLSVRAWDGLVSNYSYMVVYPNSSWYEIQGDMILAFSYNDQIVPDYQDGYRVVFLPLDGSYSNEDCKNTSLPNEGWYIYPSAGFRWIKYVQSLTIVEEG